MFTVEKLDPALFRYQDRMINNPPKDYSGSALDWEMNIILWMSKAREQILNDTFSPSTLEFIARSLERQNS